MKQADHQSRLLHNLNAAVKKLDQYVSKESFRDISLEDSFRGMSLGSTSYHSVCSDSSIKFIYGSKTNIQQQRSYAEKDPVVPPTWFPFTNIKPYDPKKYSSAMNSGRSILALNPNLIDITPTTFEEKYPMESSTLTNSKPYDSSRYSGESVSSKVEHRKMEITSTVEVRRVMTQKKVHSVIHRMSDKNVVDEYQNASKLSSRSSQSMDIRISRDSKDKLSKWKTSRPGGKNTSSDPGRTEHCESKPLKSIEEYVNSSGRDIPLDSDTRKGVKKSASVTSKRGRKVSAKKKISGTKLDDIPLIDRADIPGYLDVAFQKWITARKERLVENEHRRMEIRNKEKVEEDKFVQRCLEALERIRISKSDVVYNTKA